MHIFSADATAFSKEIKLFFCPWKHEKTYHKSCPKFFSLLYVDKNLISVSENGLRHPLWYLLCGIDWGTTSSLVVYSQRCNSCVYFLSKPSLHWYQPKPIQAHVTKKWETNPFSHFILCCKFKCIKLDWIK